MNRFPFPALAAVLFLTFPASAHSSDQWLMTLEADHPLVGKIWKPETKSFVTRAEVEKAVGGADYALLGETHNNDDHHRLQAAMVEAMVNAGKKPGIAFEMITEDKQPQLDQWRQTNPANGSGLGPSVAWDKTGWPKWRTYQPIGDVAAKTGLTVRAANLPRAMIGAIHGQGVAAIEASRRARLGLDKPLPQAAIETIRRDLFEGHCKLVPAESLSPMFGVQRARDAVLADNLVKAATATGADSGALIAGSGHARLDHAVPFYLRQIVPGKKIVSVAFVQVTQDIQDAAGYAVGFGGALPFDYVWFTPRADNIDRCAELKKRFQKRK